MKHRPISHSASRQRGVVLLFSLVALVVLLIAAVALMRSFNTSLFMSGNIAFKRDLQNQGERAIDRALANFRPGGTLDTDAARSNHLKTSNYRAVMLPVNAQGIPDALVESDSNFFASWGDAANDITPLNEPSLANQGVSIRYLIDRMSTNTGSCKTLGPGVCLLAGTPPPKGGSASNLGNDAGRGSGLITPPGTPPPPPVTLQTPVYRLTVRVVGPRDTQAFFQSTFTAP